MTRKYHNESTKSVKMLVTLFPEDIERLEAIRKAQKRNVSFAQIIRNAINAAHKEQCQEE